MRHELIHVIGTDTHGSKHRRPKIQDAVSYIKRKLEKTSARELQRKIRQK